MSNYQYKSVFAPFFNSFLDARKAIGVGIESPMLFLKELDLLFCDLNVAEPIITEKLIIAWRKSRINESDRTLYDKWSLLSQLCRYMCHLGISCHVPRLPKKSWGEYTAYIYSQKELRSIFSAADKLLLKKGNMASKVFAIPSLIRLLYSTGMRVGEATNLKNQDVMLEKGIIFLGKTKNMRDRIVPIHPSLDLVLRQYVRFRNLMPIANLEDDESPFFAGCDGKALNTGNVYCWFRKILRMAGIPYVGKNHGPRVHDLRHTCASHALMRLVREGKDIYCVLPVLATFLGHKTLDGTEHYVRLTQEMYPDIIQKQESLSSYIYPSISKLHYEED